MKLAQAVSAFKPDRRLFQKNQGPRGSIEFKPDGTSLIRLFEQSNLSTMQHELGHLSLTGAWRGVFNCAQRGRR